MKVNKYENVEQMTEKKVDVVTKYRKKFPRCKWCKNCELVVPKVVGVTPFYICDAKDKIVDPERLRLLCSCFELKEEDDD